jgi:23S rRNA (uracil1939-C5)-methyltransferase
MSSTKYKMSKNSTRGTPDLGVTAPDGASEAGPAEVQIERLAAGGRGVGRVQGKVWLVAGAVPGDRVLAAPERTLPRRVEARAARILAPASDRREPPCPIQTRCGGCPWMVLPEEVQREWKRRILEDALARIGGFRDLEPGPVRRSPTHLGYRNRIELTFGRDRGGRRVLGYHGADPAEGLVDVERCLLQDEPAARVLSRVRALLVGGEATEDPAANDPREPLRLTLRRSRATGETLVALRGRGGAFPSARDFARRLRQKCPDVAGVVLIVARPGRRGGARTELLDGRPWVEEELAGIRFRLPAGVFTQVNLEAADLLAGRVADLAGPGGGGRVLELYGGVGVLGLRLARAGARLTVCEADPDAVACGEEAARAAGLDLVEFERTDVGRYLRSSAPPETPELVLADPPRTGFGPGVAEGIARLGPARVIVVSCDPATLARDLKRLVGLGYSVRRVEPFDLFPQTAHVETVALLVREPGRRPAPPAGPRRSASGSG